MRLGHLVCSVMLVGAAAAPARAELVFFADGRTMSVKAHHAEGDTLVLILRSGGEITCGPSAVAKITADEVAHEESRGIGDSGLGIRGDSSSNPEAPIPNPTADAYAAVIDAAAARHGVDAHLVRAVIEVESGYQRNARSSKGAMGLMQIMPATAREYRIVDPYDPVANIEAGVAYLSTLLARFPKDLALAAYNAGEGAVERFRGIPPYPETQQYVTRILQLAGR